MSKKIVITGPESSGKTTLANLLAEEYDATIVIEFAREYLEQLDRPYELEDVLKMGKEQLRLESEAEGDLVFLDTDLSVYGVWIKEKYKLEIDWIEAHLKDSKNKVYLLCDVDIDWEEDPLREHPTMGDRKRLFEAYKNLLEKHQVSFQVISGNIPSRIKKCKEIIDTSN